MWIMGTQILVVLTYNFSINALWSLWNFRNNCMQSSYFLIKFRNLLMKLWPQAKHASLKIFPGSTSLTRRLSLLWIKRSACSSPHCNSSELDLQGQINHCCHLLFMQWEIPQQHFLFTQCYPIDHWAKYQPYLM